MGFIVNAYIARILNVDGFGLINYSLAFLTYLLLFSNMGLTTLGAREVAKNKDDTKIIAEITGTRILLTIFLCTLFLVFLVILPGSLIIKKIILLYILCALPYAFYLDFVFQAREEMEFVGAAKIIQYACFFIFVFLFLKNEKQILSVPISYLCGYITATVFLILIFFKKYGKFYFILEIRNIYSILIAALPIGFATIIYQAVMNFPVISLGIFHSKSDVGIFSAGYKIIFLLLIVERIFYYLFFPILSRQAKQSQAIFEKSFIFFSQLALCITLFITIAGIIFARQIITTIYGTEFLLGAGILRILLLYFLIAPLNTIWGYGLIALNLEKKFFKVIAITSSINLILIIIGVYLFKSTGVACALFISEFLGAILMKKELNSVVKFSLFTFLSKNEIKNILRP